MLGVDKLLTMLMAGWLNGHFFLDVIRNRSYFKLEENEIRVEKNGGKDF